MEFGVREQRCHRCCQGRADYRSYLGFSNMTASVSTVWLFWNRSAGKKQLLLLRDTKVRNVCGFLKHYVVWICHPEGEERLSRRPSFVDTVSLQVDIISNSLPEKVWVIFFKAACGPGGKHEVTFVFLCPQSQLAEEITFETLKKAIGKNTVTSCCSSCWLWVTLSTRQPSSPTPLGSNVFSYW